jgi:putative membrane protein
MSRVIPVTGALVAAMLATAPGAFAQDTTGSPWRTVRPERTVPDTGISSLVADTAYIRQVIRGNFTEVGAGRLAESRSENSEVKDFGERMVSDHNAMNEEWARLATENNMRVDVDFGPSGKQTIDQLDDLNGTEFDQAYMNAMIRQHENDLATFQRMSSSAQSSDVRQLASTGLSTIQQHLLLARQVGSRVGVSSTAGRVGDVTPMPLPSDTDRTRRTDDRATRNERDDGNDRAALSVEDRAFFQNTLQAHLLELRLAELAKREAKSGEIRRLAERIEKDFEGWQERWKDIAERHDLKAPSNLGPEHRERIEDFQDRAKGKNFDHRYAELVAEHLQGVVNAFEKEGQKVRPAAARRLVDDELPELRQYLARARQLER